MSSPPGPDARTFDNIEIAAQCFLQDRMSESTAIGDFAHQQVNHDRQFVHSLVEPRSCLDRGRTSNGLLQIVVCRGIVQLHGLDTAEIVVIPSKLRICG